MARPCSLCKHPERNAIESEARSGSLKGTARKYGLSHQAILRHLAPEHLGGGKVAEILAEDLAQEVEGQHGTDAVSSAPSTPPIPPRPSYKPRPRNPNTKPRPYENPANDDEWRAYFARRIRTGSLDGAKVIERLLEQNPNLDPVMLAEFMEQAAVGVELIRGTDRVRRLNMIARVERLFLRAFKREDDKAALKALEFLSKIDALHGDLNPLAALMASEGWRTIAPGLLMQFPEAYAFALRKLSAEESRKRQALAPSTITVPDPSDSAT